MGFLSRGDVTPIPKVRRVGRRAAKARACAKVRAEVLEAAGYRCQAFFVAECQGSASETHHVIPRSQGGTDTPDGLLAVCRTCHRAIHDNPLRARHLGFLKRRDLSAT